jgi:hypothetical protein
MTSWDSFFSTFAQSVAAVVGVIAAFVIARLIDAEAEYRRARNRSNELEVNAARLRDAAGAIRFEWYCNAKLNDAKTEIRKELDSPLRDVETPVAPDQFYAPGRFPVFIGRAVAMRAIEEAIGEWRFDAIEAEREARRRAESNLFFGSMHSSLLRDYPSYPGLHDTFRNVTAEANLDREISDEADQIAALIVDVKHHMRLIQLHLNSIEGNPQKSSLVAWVLGILAFLYAIGLVYPLSFLPSSGGPLKMGGIDAFLAILLSFKGALLTLMSVGFGGLLLLLYRANARLTHSPHQIVRLESATRLGYYSPYLKTMEENEAWAAFIKMKQLQHAPFLPKKDAEKFASPS